MNKHFTFLTRRGIFFCGVLSLSLLLTNCSNDDDQVEPEPPTYEFGEDFEDIEDLPEVADEDPEFTEPDTGELNGSTATTGIIAELEAGDASAETEANLKAVEDFAASLPAESTAAAESLDADAIDAILNAEDLEGDLASLEASLEDLPEEVAALLPTVTLSADYDEMAVRSEAGKSPFIDFGDNNIVAQAVNGDCIEAATMAYDNVMDDLNEQRDAQLATIESNYERRLTEADTRYDSRVVSLDEKKATYMAEISTTALEILAVATAAEQAGATELANQLELLALIYTVKGKSIIDSWYATTSELLVEITVEEKATIESIRDDREATVITNYEAAKAEADATYADITATCHNQGSGN